MSAETAAVSPAANGGRGAEPKRRSGGSGRSPRRIPARAGIGALRGIPARMGRARRRLGRGERLFPGVAFSFCQSAKLPKPKQRREPSWGSSKIPVRITLE